MKKIHVLSTNDLRVSVPCLVPSKRVSVLARLASRSRRGVTMQHLGPAGIRDRIEIDNLLVRLGFGRDHFDIVRKEMQWKNLLPGLIFKLVHVEVPVPHEDSRNDLDLVIFHVPMGKAEAFLRRLQKIRGVEMVQAPTEKKSRKKTKVVQIDKVRMTG